MDFFKEKYVGPGKLPRCRALNVTIRYMHINGLEYAVPLGYGFTRIVFFFGNIFFYLLCKFKTKRMLGFYHSPLTLQAIRSPRNNFLARFSVKQKQEQPGWCI